VTRAVRTALTAALAFVLLGVAPSPVPSASPTAAPRELKSIVTVISSPYCNALAEHFNAALRPMLANDRVFDAVGVQMDAMNDMFDHPDYVNRFLDLRVKMSKESDTLIASLHPIRAEIDQLRNAASLTTDPVAAAQMRDAAQKLGDAYQHQFQLATDVTSLAQFMMQYNIERGGHPLSGWTPQLQAMPEDSKDVKIVVHYNKQRDAISTAEDNATDIAYEIASTRCTK
jgi:hypothetical protein